MILILSDSLEPSTDDVIDWLRHFKTKFIRLNGDHLIELILARSSKALTWSISFKSQNQTINLSDFDSYWYRRGHLIFKFPEVNTSSKEFNSQIGRQSLLEQIGLRDFVHSQLKKKNHIGVKASLN